MTSREWFKKEWLANNDGDNEGFTESNFNSYKDSWFDAFKEMYEHLNSNPDTPKSNARFFMQNPQHDMVNDEQWSTLSWNVSWIHADFVTKK